MEPADPQSALIAEQIAHALDLLKADLAAIRSDVDHLRQMSDHRLSALEDCQKDMESRLRSATDGVTQFKVWSGVSGSGSLLISLLAILRTITGGL